MSEASDEYYKDELAEAQRGFDDRFRQVIDDGAEPEALVSFASELGGTLLDFASRDRLWSDLEKGTPRELDRQQLTQLMLVDWEAYLERMSGSSWNFNGGPMTITP